MVFMPAIFTLGPLGAAFYFFVGTIIELGYKCGCHKRRRSKGCCCCFFSYLLWVLIGLAFILPLYLALAAIAAGLLLGLASVPAIYYGFAYIIRVTYNVAIL